MVRKVPQRRNKLAGSKKGKSKSAKYFQSHPEARAKKNKYNTKYHSSPIRKAYRATLNKANKQSPNRKNQDKSHTSSGRIVNELSSKNRARQGKGRRARYKG